MVQCALLRRKLLHRSIGAAPQIAAPQHWCSAAK